MAQTTVQSEIIRDHERATVILDITLRLLTTLPDDVPATDREYLEEQANPALRMLKHSEAQAIERTIDKEIEAGKQLLSDTLMEKLLPLDRALFQSIQQIKKRLIQRRIQK